MNLTLALALAFTVAQGVPRSRPIIVASKPFGESYILCEMFAQLLEARGFRVDRRPGLGATEIAFAALRTNAIDVYPEYTGTGLLAILGDTTRRSPTQAFTRVSTEFRRQYGTRWLPPLGPARGPPGACPVDQREGAEARVVLGRQPTHLAGHCLGWASRGIAPRAPGDLTHTSC